MQEILPPSARQVSSIGFHMARRALVFKLDQGVPVYGLTSSERIVIAPLTRKPHAHRTTEAFLNPYLQSVLLASSKV